MTGRFIAGQEFQITERDDPGGPEGRCRPRFTRPAGRLQGEIHLYPMINSSVVGLGILLAAVSGLMNGTFALPVLTGVGQAGADSFPENLPF